jgi:parvulin-like peptidyl-prolyl cis-trans isomerase-like protein
MIEMKRRTALASLVVTLALAGCDSLKDAFSAHVDVAAKAGGRELSINQLATLMGGSIAPLQKEVAYALTDAWVDYHLAAQAAANNDSLKDEKLVDEAMWAAIANIKARKWYEQVSKSWKAPDSSLVETEYNNGGVLSASHILLLTQGMADTAKARVKKQADQLRTQVTQANFATLAKSRSQDRQSALQGGALGAFPRGAMVPQFEQALLAIKPGEISPVIETQYGYHIIRRPLFSEVKSQIVAATQQRGAQVSESTYVASLERGANVQIKPGMAATVRAVVENPNSHRDDRTVLATSKIGKFTAADVARWMETFPPQAQIQQRIKNAPDSLLPMFVGNFVRNELVLHSADSAHVGPTAEELKQIRAYAKTALVNAWKQLNIDPSSLATAKSKEDKEKIAEDRMDNYVRDLMAQKAVYVDLTAPVQHMLRKKYDWSIKTDAVDRSLVEAAKVRLNTDTTKKAGQPSSVVPVPNRDTTKK